MHPEKTAPEMHRNAFTLSDLCPRMPPRDLNAPEPPRDGCSTGYAVCVRFASGQKRRLCRPEPTSCGEGQPIWDERPLLLCRNDGTYELMGISSNLSGLARWVLSFAGDAEVESPRVLREQVRHAAQQVVALYSAAESSS